MSFPHYSLATTTLSSSIRLRRRGTWHSRFVSGNPPPQFTGPNVYGYNLNGDYERFMPERNLTTTAIDCSNLGHVTLRFRRWLGVMDIPDHAYIRLSEDGINFYYYRWFNESEVFDGDWQLVEYDISGYADGEPTIYIQWTMGPMSSFGRACGWNIDDVEILGVEQGVPPHPGDGK
jgi:hypothetical protein